jgi:hypothetical protein
MSEDELVPIPQIAESDDDEELLEAHHSTSSAGPQLIGQQQQIFAAPDIPYPEPPPFIEFESGPSFDQGSSPIQRESGDPHLAPTDHQAPSSTPPLNCADVWPHPSPSTIMSLIQQFGTAALVEQAPPTPRLDRRYNQSIRTTIDPADFVIHPSSPLFALPSVLQSPFEMSTRLSPPPSEDLPMADPTPGERKDSDPRQEPARKPRESVEENSGSNQEEHPKEGRDATHDMETENPHPEGPQVEAPVHDHDARREETREADEDMDVDDPQPPKSADQQVPVADTGKDRKEAENPEEDTEDVRSGKDGTNAPSPRVHDSGSKSGKSVVGPAAPTRHSSRNASRQPHKDPRPTETAPQKHVKGKGVSRDKSKPVPIKSSARHLNMFLGNLPPEKPSPTNMLDVTPIPVSDYFLVLDHWQLITNPVHIRTSRARDILAGPIGTGQKVRVQHARQRRKFSFRSRLRSMLICCAIQANLEFDILRRVHELVKADYVDGKPRYHLPSAREEKYTADASCIFLVHYEKFRTMSHEQKLAIIKHRDILVEDCPQDKFGWDTETFMQFGSLELSRDIQGNFVCPITSYPCLITYDSWAIAR